MYLHKMLPVTGSSTKSCRIFSFTPSIFHALIRSSAKIAEARHIIQIHHHLALFSIPCSRSIPINTDQLEKLCKVPN
ncbi:hypothetical protein DFP98_101114 [Cohnella phaseoli]|uniref:Uncharacterized protein n=1 Tax=Cohnella phaseoli TaxID=456490 RepID=A0A3D9KR08_9BACL|nr:hypothetical protein DFP98_101114 [Cohnella phaseoli]